MKKLLAMLLALLLALSLLPAALAEEAVEEDTRPRTIVTTDGEVDDMDTFMRFLLYSNEFDIEGIVYSASQWHYAGDGQGTLFTSEMESTASHGTASAPTCAGAARTGSRSRSTSTPRFMPTWSSMTPTTPPPASCSAR